MKLELYINNKDAFAQWGVVFTDEAYTALLTPPPVKGYVENKSTAIHGKQVLTAGAPKVDERDIQITFYLVAKTRAQFLSRYANFVEELKGGTLAIRTKYQPGVVYHCLYISCAQFSQYNGKMGKFVLKLNEPNPNNRV